MADTSATYNTSITADLPDFAAGIITFTNLAMFTSGNEEVLPGLAYALTLDGGGQGTQVLPTPDNTGDVAANWGISLPDTFYDEYAIAYDAGNQALSDILAAGATTTDPDSITAALADKQAKDTDAVEGNLAFFNDDGTTVDSSIPASWNSTDSTMNITHSANVTGQVNQEFFLLGRNNTGSQIDDGDVVKIAGSTGDRLTVALAQADSVANSRQIGMATEDIANGTEGFVTIAGLVRGLDTSAYSEGDVLYLSTSVAGAVTTTKPTWPAIAIEVATVVRDHPSLGMLFVGAYETGSGAYDKASNAAAASVPKDAAILSKSANYPLAAGDEAKIIECDGTFTITCPDSLDSGFQVVVVNVGSGTITIAADTTLQSKDSAVDLANQYGAATVYHRGSNVWLAFGDLE